MRVQVFPYAFARYTTLHHQEFKVMELQQADQHLDTLQRLTAQYNSAKDTLCDLLFFEIQQQGDDNIRQLIIRLKRMAFNEKVPDEQLLQQISPQLSPTANTALSNYISLHTEKIQWQSYWQSHFDEQLVLHRKQLQQLSTSQHLQNGLLLSSPVLFDQLPAFRNRPADNFRHKEAKNEYSLLRYLSRMTFKTSPFSTFTYTGVANITTAQQHLTIPHPETVKSGIRLNNTLFSYLQTLMVHHPQLNEILKIRLNNTTVIEDTHLHFLVNCFNIESFQRMPAGGLTRWLHQYFSEAQQDISLQALIDTLLPQIADADRQSIKAFVLKLVHAGLLEAGTGCSGISPEWDIALIKFLQSHCDTHNAVLPLLSLLQELHSIRNEYTVATPLLRRPLLEKAADQLNAVLDDLHEQAGFQRVKDHPQETIREAIIKEQLEAAAFETNVFSPRHFPPANIFYEDAATPELADLPATQVQHFIEKTDQLCHALTLLDDLEDERHLMRNFFLKQYHAQDTPSITTFYHAYYLQEKKVRKTANNTDPRKNIPPAIKAALINYLDIQHTNAYQVSVTPRHTADWATLRHPKAMGIFTQLFTETGNDEPVLKGVINNLLPGMGKVAGRFLDLFDPAITALFTAWNVKLHPNVMLMELSDGSSFNANIHPPLLSYEICIPGGYNNYSPHQQAQLKDIVVRLDSQTDTLILWHTPSGKQIYAYDLCLESFYMRSNFYQLLAHFNPDCHIPLRRFIHMIDEAQLAKYPPTQPGVVFKPRITCSGDVIIRRQGWLIDVATIPLQLKDERDADYFLRLNNWRKELNIPAQIFMILRTHYSTISPDEKNELQRDDYKPQYINFNSPLLILLWKKLLTRAGRQIYMEEMLPHTTHLQQQGDLPVAEHLLHWYKM